MDVFAREFPTDKHMLYIEIGSNHVLQFGSNHGSYMLLLILVYKNFPNQTCHKIGSPAPKPGVPNPHGLIDVGKKGRYLKCFKDVDGCSWKFRNVSWMLMIVHECQCMLMDVNGQCLH